LTCESSARRRRARTFAAYALSVSSLSGALGACKHEQTAPTPSASATTPSPVASVDESARQARFESELQRSRALWHDPPNLGNCAELLKEKADTELCTKAQSALTAVAALDAAAPPATVIDTLAAGALALTRLVERVRYLSLEDLSNVRVSGDAGPPATTGSSEPAPNAAAGLEPQTRQRALLRELRARRTLKLADSPHSRLLQDADRLEHEVLRHFAAYLEYAPLAVRRSAFERAKAMRAEHPSWSALGRVLREAALLETDRDLKRELEQLANLTLPRGTRPDQPTGSK
jgi:hypothetical protein